MKGLAGFAFKLRKSIIHTIRSLSQTLGVIDEDYREFLLHCVCGLLSAQKTWTEGGKRELYYPQRSFDLKNLPRKSANKCNGSGLS